jgi:mercuric ion binding protein
MRPQLLASDVATRTKRFLALGLALLSLAASTTNCKARPSASVTLRIEGMVCDSCAQTIEHELVRRDGVSAAKVTYNSRKALVQYAPDKTNPAALIRAVADLGYSARAIDVPPPDAD